jgi:hypothetical protein
MQSWATGAVIAANQVVDNQAVDEVQQPRACVAGWVEPAGVYTARSFFSRSEHPSNA